MSEALFKYRVRFSPKAKNIRLKITLRHGLEVIVPKGYDIAKVPALLEKKKSWIKAALERSESNRKFFEPEPRWQIPMTIALPAIGRVWHVKCQPSDFSSVAVREIIPGQLLMYGNTDNERACMAALQRWLLRQAKDSLIAILEATSKRTRLRYNRVFIKRQRTRWASCSRNRSIALNAKMLFLPPDVIQYAIIHELCHIKEMNHSKRFWSLVQQHCPGYRKLDRTLRDSWKAIPKWAN